MTEKPLKSIVQIIREDGRYSIEAVEFIREALSFTVEKHRRLTDGPKSAKMDELISGIRRHVSGAQLCLGLRELASERWGLLARQVLKRWKIISTRDFGEVVFLLVDNGWMQKQPQDSIEDFEDIYDFTEAFDHNFEILLD